MRILFIGNSYTYYNSMPDIFAALAKDSGKDVQVDAVTKGGGCLIENIESADEYREKIAALKDVTDYDILILQEQSYTPISDRECFERGVISLSNWIAPKRCILYATWGRKTGAPLLKELGLSSLGMTLALEMAYTGIANKIGADVAYVGRAFAAVGATHAELELYNNDGSHPSYTGSVLAALVLYKAVFGEMPQEYASLELDCGIIAALLDIVDGL